MKKTGSKAKDIKQSTPYLELTRWRGDYLEGSRNGTAQVALKRNLVGIQAGFNVR